MTDHPSNPPSQEPTFPIQCKRGAKAHPLRVPWAIAELAYSVYAGENGTQQSLADLAARGGFGPSEMDVFLPDWREQCSALAAQEARHKAELADARAGHTRWKDYYVDCNALRLEAESKLREATEALSALGYSTDYDSKIARSARASLAAIRSGPAQQAAPRKRNVLHPDGTCCCEEHGCFANAPMGCDCDSPADPPEQETPKRQGCPARSWVQAHVIPPHVQPPTCTECGRVFL